MLGRPFKATLLGSLAILTAASTPDALADRGEQVVLRGHVTSTGAIHIRQGDGRHVRYDGPAPGRSLRHGAAVAIGFTTADLQGTANVQRDYAGQTAVDGIYNITVTAPGEAGSTALAYDAENGSYSLAGDSSADRSMIFDANTGQLLECSPNCAGAGSAGRNLASAPGAGFGSGGSFALVGGSVILDSPELNGGDAAAGADASGRPALAVVEDAVAVSQDPSDSESGQTDATEVPAPGMLLLFAMACAALPLRRRGLRPA